MEEVGKRRDVDVMLIYQVAVHNHVKYAIPRIADTPSAQHPERTSCVLIVFHHLLNLTSLFKPSKASSEASFLHR